MSLPGGTDGPGWGAHGQGPLLKDVHCALLRLMEGLDEEIQEAPTLAGYGSAADLGPQEAYRCYRAETQPTRPPCFTSWKWTLQDCVAETAGFFKLGMLRLSWRHQRPHRMCAGKAGMGMIMNTFSVLPVNHLPLSMEEQHREHRQNTKNRQRAGDPASPHIVLQ